MSASTADPRLTEWPNPRTESIDTAGSSDIVAMIQAEDRGVPAAVESQSGAIAAVVEDVARRFRRGGRLIYVGAGTSGRLGVLDASECPPTFGTEPDVVRGVIAGGPEALSRSSEGAEDDAAGGGAAIAELDVGPADLVLGIATSGTTPYVHGALAEAHARGAGLAFLSCTAPPESILSLGALPITPLVGPEVIAGSTRMKAGTATKLVLNTITTGAMIRSGRVYRNLMVDLRARSDKLVDRGIRIVSQVCEVEAETARRTLVKAGGSVKTALAMRLLDRDRGLAERDLDAVDGFLRVAIDRRAAGRTGYYCGYPERPGWPDAATMRLDLEAAPARLAEALAEGEAADARGDLVPIPGREWGPEAHVAHLIAFEEEAVTARVARLGTEDDPVFEGWEPAARPAVGDGADFEGLVARFASARERTLSLLEDPAWERTGRLGEERVTLYQLLRGVRQHDAAHALRIRERVHPSLLVARGSG